MNRLLLPTRTSPRKRLQLSDSPPSKKNSGKNASSNVDHLTDNMNSLPISNLFNTPSPDKTAGIVNRRSPISKKIRSELNFSSGDLVGSPGNLRTSPLILMKGLTPEQLVGMIGKMLEKHPEIEEEMSDMMPIPDLKHMEDKLVYLKRNIFKVTTENGVFPNFF